MNKYFRKSRDCPYKGITSDSGTMWFPCPFSECVKDSCPYETGAVVTNQDRFFVVTNLAGREIVTTKIQI